MRLRDVLGVLALAAICVAIAGGIERLRDGRSRPAADSAPLPRPGLVLAVGGAKLVPALASLDASPFWAGTLRPAERALRVADDGPGALGLYRRGWVVVTSSPGPGSPDSIRYGAWRATASTPDRLPRPGTAELDVPLPGRGAALLWTRPADLAGASAWSRAFPSRADGIVDARAGRESWRLTCESPCWLEALRPSVGGTAGPVLWDGLPPEPVALAEAFFDPARLETALDVAAIGDAERFLGLPVRRELARALAGHAVVALIEEPAPGAPGSILALFDLAQPDAARALVERTLALGILSGEIGVERFRDVTVGAWTRPGRGLDLRPAVAIDGDVLVVATRKDDLLAALDRRRRPRPAEPAARAALESVGPGAWRGWSRSAFLGNAWFEILTGRPAQPPIPPGEVAARLVRRDGGWVLESRGPGPAFAADPVLPTVRALVRAARAAR